MTITAAADLYADGWLSLPALLPAPVVAAARSAVQALREQRGGHDCARPNNTLVPLRWDDSVVMAALSEPSVEADLRAVTGGGDLRWTSAYLSLKDASSGALWWHSDWWAWDHPLTHRIAPAQVAVLCYLDDTASETGALRLLPGSHLRSVPMHALLPSAYDDPAVADDPAHPAMADHAGQVTVSARAGDAVVLDYRVLHGTHPNGADHLRACLILNFTPDWLSLPADVQAHLARGLALPCNATEREAAMASVVAHLLPREPDATVGDVALSRNAPPVFVNDA